MRGHERRGRSAAPGLLALALILGAGGLSACGSSVVHRARRASRTTAASLTRPGGYSIIAAPVRVAHTRLGPVGYRVLGSGPPVLLIMGFGGTMEDWDPVFVDALARSHRVVTFDNAGIGRTQALPAPLTIGAMASQTSALIATLHLGRPDVIGWSMGGMIAQALAVQHPGQVRRLVLCATQSGMGKALPPPAAAAAAAASRNPVSVLATLFPDDQGAAADAYGAGVLSYPGQTLVPHATLVDQTRALVAWLRGEDAAGRRIAAVSAPTLVADGAVDALDPVSNDHQLAGLLPLAQLVLYPDAGHGFLFQDERTFVPRVDAFLR